MQSPIRPTRGDAMSKHPKVTKPGRSVDAWAILFIVAGFCLPVSERSMRLTNVSDQASSAGRTDQIMNAGCYSMMIA